MSTDSSIRSTPYARHSAKKKMEIPNPVCPEAHLHTPCPVTYVAWHEWAEDRSRSFTNDRPCPGCGLYLIWRRLPSRRGRTVRR